MTEQMIVRGRWLIVDCETFVEDGAVLVEDEAIAEVGAWADLRSRHPEAHVIGSESTAVLPGLINAHHHSAGATALQHGIPDLLLEPWLLMHARMRQGDPYLDTLLSAARLLRTGVTSVVEVHSGLGTPDAYAETCRRALTAYDEAGIRVAFRPRINSGWFTPASGSPGGDLLEIAAFAVRNGMDAEAALRSVTIDAATIIGMEDRIGSLEPGKDADLLILRGHPFQTHSVPEAVFIDGEIVYQRDPDARTRLTASGGGER